MGDVVISRAGGAPRRMDSDVQITHAGPGIPALSLVTPDHSTIDGDGTHFHPLHVIAAPDVGPLLNIADNNTTVNLVGTHNDLDPWHGGPHTTFVQIDLVGGSGATVTGIVAGADGDMMIVWCGGGGSVPEDTVTLVNNSSASLPANRLWIANGKGVNIPNNDGVWFRYIGGFGWVAIGSATSYVRAQELSLDPSTTPAALANGSTTNDYDPFAGLAFTSYVKQDTGALSTITGLVAAGAPNSEGRLLVFQNISTTGTIVVKNNDGASIADNRILCPNNRDVSLGPQCSMVLSYDDTVAMWRVVSAPSTLASTSQIFRYVADGTETDTIVIGAAQGFAPRASDNYNVQITRGELAGNFYDLAAPPSLFHTTDFTLRIGALHPTAGDSFLFTVEDLS